MCRETSLSYINKEHLRQAKNGLISNENLNKAGIGWEENHYFM